jgi:hypothetical protein
MGKLKNIIMKSEEKIINNDFFLLLFLLITIAAVTNTFLKVGGNKVEYIYSQF